MAHALPASRPLDGFRKRGRALGDAAVRLAKAEPRATVALGLGATAALAAAAIQMLSDGALTSAPPPAPPPMLVQPVAPEQARMINAALPLEDSDNPAARPFLFKGSNVARAQALQCLASAVYYEAGNQDVNGARAVAQVVLNRVRHPAFPGSVCGVVYQGSTRVTGCQFTFTCDGSLARRPDPAGWSRAKAIAEAALVGAVYAPVGWATHYHADYVVPVWAASLAKNAVVGAHMFYHWAGGWGRPGAFDQSYRGGEANAEALRTAALAAEAATAGREQAGDVAAITALPGVETIKLTPSMRGDKRVAVRFNQVAHEASEKAVHEDYVKRVEATDNLKFALSSETTSTSEAPLGAKPAN
jgi:spore germination cell wall hydrolase CwlJ-like protein